jgi:uncharacterized protein YbjT (DUF2867 family)
MKKYVITGSIGHISKPVVEGLVKDGQAVTVITSNAANVSAIEALGAKALTGSVDDAAFVNKAFQGADVVYTMIPPIWKTENWRVSQDKVADVYADAIRNNNVPYVVNLSSIGAHLGKGCGPVDGLHYFEQKLNAIAGLQVKHIRPSFFYYNLLNQIPLVKQAGILGSNYGESNQKLALVHTADIAGVVLQELRALSFTGNSVRYVVSDIRTLSDIASVLGKSIGKEIPWVNFSDSDQKAGLLQAGISETHAQGYTDMGSAVRSGKMQEEVLKETPPKDFVKLEDFAKEFSKAFQA